MVAGVAESVMYIGATLAFFVVLGLVITIGYAVLGPVVEVMRLEPKGFLGIMLSVVIPTGAGFWAGERLVLRRLGRFSDRLERWKAQTQ